MGLPRIDIAGEFNPIDRCTEQIHEQVNRERQTVRILRQIELMLDGRRPDPVSVSIALRWLARINDDDQEEHRE